MYMYQHLVKKVNTVTLLLAAGQIPPVRNHDYTSVLSRHRRTSKTIPIFKEKIGGIMVRPW